MIALDRLHANDLETIPLTAIVDSALCIGAGGSSGSLADKAIVRTASGQLMIPGSHLKGRLRHECEKLGASLGWEIFYAPSANLLSPDVGTYPQEYEVNSYRGFHCPVSQMFGDPFLASRIVLDDLICNEEREFLPEVNRPSVSINRRRRTAEESKLFFLETSPVAAKLRFSGNLYISQDAPPWTKPLVLAGLRHIQALGGSKSAGLGWLSWDELGIISEDDSAWASLLPEVNHETN